MRATSEVIAAILVALAASACGGGAGPEPEPAPRPDSEVDRAALEALYRARVDSARMRFTEADVRFTTGMIVHHAQALVMAALAPGHGASPAVRRLAARIVNAQQDEIRTMQRWLRDRGQPVPDVTIEGTTMTVHGIDEDPSHGHGHAAGDHADPERGARERMRDGHAAGRAMTGMHGMLTAEELRELDRARGEKFDRLFLTYMIRHHRGAVTMVRELFDTPGAAQEQEMFRLASEIQADQLTEIARMERMLEETFGPDGIR